MAAGNTAERGTILPADRQTRLRVGRIHLKVLSNGGNAQALSIATRKITIDFFGKSCSRWQTSGRFAMGHAACDAPSAWRPVSRAMRGYGMITIVSDRSKIIRSPNRQPRSAPFCHNLPSSATFCHILPGLPGLPVLPSQRPRQMAAGRLANWQPADWQIGIKTAPTS